MDLPCHSVNFARFLVLWSQKSDHKSLFFFELWRSSHVECVTELSPLIREWKWGKFHTVHIHYISSATNITRSFLSTFLQNICSLSCPRFHSWQNYSLCIAFSLSISESRRVVDNPILERRKFTNLLISRSVLFTYPRRHGCCDKCCCSSDHQSAQLV